MKKILILIVFPILLLNSCYDDTCDSVPPAKKIYTYFVTVNPREWQEDSDFGYAYTTLSFPEITQYVYDYGSVLVYLEDGNRQNLLPYIYPEVDEVGTYLLNTRFDFEVGFLTVIAEASDFFYTPPINPLTFKVVIMRD